MDWTYGGDFELSKNSLATKRLRLLYLSVILPQASNCKIWTVPCLLLRLSMMRTQAISTFLATSYMVAM